MMDYRRPRRFDGSTLAPDLGMSSRKHAVRRTCQRPIPILLDPAPAPGMEHSRSLETGLLQREARSRSPGGTWCRSRTCTDMALSSAGAREGPGYSDTALESAGRPYQRCRNLLKKGPRPQIARFPGPGVYFGRPRAPTGRGRRSIDREARHAWRRPGSPGSSTRWGPCSRSGARTRSAAGPITTPRRRCKGMPSDLSEMIADGSLADDAGDRRDDVRQDRPARDDRPAPLVRRAEAGDAPRPGRPAPRPGPGAEEDPGAARDAEDREPGRPPRGGRGGEDRRRSRASAPRPRRRSSKGSTFVEIGRRPHPAEHGPAARRADLRGGPGPSAASSAPRSAAASDVGPRRSATSTSSSPPTDPAPVLDRLRRRCPEVAQVLAHGADQGERPPGRRRAVRPPRRRGRPVRLRPALLHRLEGAQHRDAEAGHRPRDCTLNEYGLVGPDGPGRLRDRGRPLRRPGPGLHPARAPRGHRRDRARRARPAPPPGRARRPDRDLPLPHRLERRRRHDPGGDGRGRPRRSG